MGRIKSFLVHPGESTSADYENVLKLHRSPTQASLLWLEEGEAITRKDIEVFHQIREHRNVIAHMLPHFLSNADYEIDIELFKSIRSLLNKIEVWWIREVEIPCNPDFDGQDLSEAEIIPGPVISMDFILSCALEEKTPTS